ncbi:MAG: MBL fold metallo-hydrolase [Alphaproteobacteria bacterium]
MRVTVLGCGPSTGVPAVGPDGWGACDPTEPKNHRRRASIVVERGGTRVLVDTSPDLRVQLLDSGIWKVDAVLFTHAHADHVNGIDDIRSLNYYGGGALDGWAERATLDILAQRFAYVFEPYRSTPPTFWRPCVTPREITGPFSVGELDVVPFRQEHGRMPTLGFRFGPFAYSTDAAGLPEDAFDALRGVDTWMVDCLSDSPHPTHSHVERTLDWIARVRPRRAVLTHMGFRLDYAALRARLPDGVEPAYDGMAIEV